MESVVHSSPRTPDTSKFTVFRKLPTELRLKIWRSAFPRTGHFGIDHRPSTDSGESRDVWDAENRAAPPVTLSVNQESRAETLKHYMAIQRSSTGDRAIYVDSANDMCWVEFMTFMCYNPPFYDRLCSLAQSPFVDRISKLEVRDCFYHEFFKMVLKDNMIKSAGDMRLVYFGSLVQFRSLEEVCFTGTVNDTKWIGETGKEGAKWMKQWIAAFLEDNKGSFKGGNAPKVVFRPYKRFQEAVEEHWS